MGIGPLCDHGCRVVCEKTSITVYSLDDDVLLHRRQEPKGAKLWRFVLRPKGHTSLPGDYSTRPTALNAYNLPSVAALVCYLHACAGFPVRSIWLVDVKSGNFASWPGLTYENATKYCPVSIDSLKGYMTQTRQDLCITKPKTLNKEALPGITSQIPSVKSKELYVVIEPINKLYTDGMVRSPVRSHIGNHYIMLAYQVDTNNILVEPFQYRHDQHRFAAYDHIMAKK